MFFVSIIVKDALPAAKQAFLQYLCSTLKLCRFVCSPRPRIETHRVRSTEYAACSPHPSVSPRSAAYYRIGG